MRNRKGKRDSWQKVVIELLKKTGKSLLSTVNQSDVVLLHYLLHIDGMMRDLESLLTGSQTNGYLVLAEVFVSGQFVCDSFESRFSCGSRDLCYVVFYS